MLKCLNDYKWVLVFAVLVALAAGVFAWQKDKYNVSLSLTISRAGTQNSVDYKYDSYYALKASDEFGNAVEGWFKTPETAQAIYKQAGLDLGASTLASLSRRFQAVKISPTTVEVRFGAISANDAKNISSHKSVFEGENKAIPYPRLIRYNSLQQQFKFPSKQKY